MPQLFCVRRFLSEKNVGEKKVGNRKKLIIDKGNIARFVYCICADKVRPSGRTWHPSAKKDAIRWQKTHPLSFDTTTCRTVVRSYSLEKTLPDSRLEQIKL
jgi:hypothetical protein